MLGKGDICKQMKKNRDSYPNGTNGAKGKLFVDKCLYLFNKLEVIAHADATFISCNWHLKTSPS